MKSRLLVSVASGALMIAGASAPAHADHKVYSPYVEKGVLELEMRGHRTVDSSAAKDDQQTHKYEVGYGITDWWQASVFGRIDKEPGEDFRYSASAIENIFQLTEQGKYWIDVGLYLEYDKSHLASETDELETKLLLQKDVGPLALTANLIFNREIGSGSGKGVGFEYAVRANYPWKREIQFGVEAYGEPGRLTGFDEVAAQEHILGPVISGEFPITGMSAVVGYQLGYLFGLTDGSPQGTLKWLLELEIPF